MRVQLFTDGENSVSGDLTNAPIISHQQKCYDTSRTGRGEGWDQGGGAYTCRAPPPLPPASLPSHSTLLFPCPTQAAQLRICPSLPCGLCLSRISLSPALTPDSPPFTKQLLQEQRPEAAGEQQEASPGGPGGEGGGEGRPLAAMAATSSNAVLPPPAEGGGQSAASAAFALGGGGHGSFARRPESPVASSGDWANGLTATALQRIPGGCEEPHQVVSRGAEVSSRGCPASPP